MNRFFGALGLCADGVRGLLAGTQRRPALAVGLGLLLTVLWPAGVQAEATSGSAESVAAPARPGRAPDLFGFTTLRLGKTLYDRVWREAAWSPLPEGHPELDATVTRLSALPLPQRVQEANAWVNARKTRAPDRFSINHKWGHLAKVLTEGCGEREAAAIAKLQLLAAAGVPRRDMYLVFVQDWERVIDDYLLVVRDGDQLYVLRSKQDAFVDPVQATRYVPLLAFSSEGAWIFAKRRGGGQVSFSPASLRRVSLGYATVRPARASDNATVVAQGR